MVVAITTRLPNRRHHRPLNGIDRSDPNPGASSASPSSAALAPSRSRVAGSLETHEPRRNPLTANTRAVASAARPSRWSAAGPRRAGVTRST